MAARDYISFALSLAIVLPLLAGCSHNKSDKLPDDARFIAAKSGRLGFNSTDSGSVYIMDASTDKIVYSTPIHPGDRLLLYTDKNQILLNGTVVKETTLDPKRIYRIYFSKG